MAFFSKTNVMIIFLQKLAVVGEKSANVFGENIFKIITSATRFGFFDRFLVFMYLDPLSTDFRSLQQWAQRIPSVEAEDERRISRLMEKLPEMTKGNIRDRFYQERI
jgi:hypothetical protein